MWANVCMVAYVKLIRIWNLKGSYKKNCLFGISGTLEAQFLKRDSMFCLFVDIRPNSNQISKEIGNIVVNLWEIYLKTQPERAKTGP